jgi:hypothetical protein
MDPTEGSAHKSIPLAPPRSANGPCSNGRLGRPGQREARPHPTRNRRPENIPVIPASQRSPHPLVIPTSERSAARRNLLPAVSIRKSTQLQPCRRRFRISARLQPCRRRFRISAQLQPCRRRFRISAQLQPCRRRFRIRARLQPCRRDKRKSGLQPLREN